LIQCKEECSDNVLPDSFTDLLVEHIKYLQGLGLPSKITMKIALKQADPMIACLLLTGKVDAIFSNDSDFAAYCGKKCLYIKDFHLVVQMGRNNNEQELHGGIFGKIVLSTGDKLVADHVIASLHGQFPESNKRCHEPKYPLFCGKDDPML